MIYLNYIGIMCNKLFDKSNSINYSDRFSNYWDYDVNNILHNYTFKQF